ncbi:predicted protein [Postia placenta Mad-698-R]|nr:predicted protein [Postia placenta Mad-698-R]
MSESRMNEAQFLQLYQYGLIEEYFRVMAICVYMTMFVNAALADARLGLFVYDSVISFNLEWRAVWSRKITGATAIYLALRYVTLANVVTYVITGTVTSCEIMLNYVGPSALISNLVEIGTFCGTYLAQAVQQSNGMWLAAFASIRVYAIDGRRWTKAAIVMMLGLVPVAINIYAGSQTSLTYIAQFCTMRFSMSASKYNMSDPDVQDVRQLMCTSPELEYDVFTAFPVLLITRICVLMSNVLVVISTWQATCANQTVTALNSRGSLTAVLFRDGTVYFALVVGLNAANIVVALLQEESIDLSAPVELIGTVVLCRFFLNLRHFSSGPDVHNSNMSSHASAFSSFASRIIGNLGEMLEDDPPAPDDDFEGELDGLNDAEDVDGPMPDTAESFQRVLMNTLCDLLFSYTHFEAGAFISVQRLTGLARAQLSVSFWIQCSIVTVETSQAPSMCDQVCYSVINSHLRQAGLLPPSNTGGTETRSMGQALDENCQRNILHDKSLGYQACGIGMEPSTASAKDEGDHARVPYHLVDGVLCRFLLELHNSLDLFEAKVSIIPSPGSSLLIVTGITIGTLGYMLEESLRPLTMASTVDNSNNAGKLEPADGLHDVGNAVSKANEDRVAITHSTEAGTSRGKREASGSALNQCSIDIVWSVAL